MSTQVAPQHFALARTLHGYGANVTAIKYGEKAPAHRWRHWHAERQAEVDVRGLPWHNADRAGIINGFAGWRSFDIDKSTGYAPVRALLDALGLPDDYPWVERSDSDEGYHVWAICTDDLPRGALPTKRRLDDGDEPGVYWGRSKAGDFHHLEVRWEHNQTIIAASRDSARWVNEPPDGPPARVTAGEVINGFYTLAARDDPAPQSEQTRRSSLPTDDDRSDLDAIKARFDMVAYATRQFSGEPQHEANGEVRILGNGGLIIDPDDGLWYRFDGEVGGDSFDLVGGVLFGEAWDRRSSMFAEAKKEAAAFAGVNLADYRRAPAPPREPTPIRGFGDMTPLPPPEPNADTKPPVRPLTDLGNAERLVDRHGNDLKYIVNRGHWGCWDGTRWQIDDTGEVFRRMMQTVRDMLREAGEEDAPQARAELAKHAVKSEAEARINAAVSLAEKHAGIPIHITDFDRDPWLLNCLNGTLELKVGGELREHRRGDLLSKRTSIAYDRTAECPTWLAYLEKVMDGNRNVIAFLRRAIGYSLTALTAEQVFFILYGNGSNGKTTFLEVLRALLEAYAQNADFRTFTERKNDNGATSDIARMVGARLITSAEVRDGARLNESMIKNLTGGDMITARFLYQDEFDFPPTHKLWLSVNHRPIIKGTDTAIWRRPLLIPFTVTIGDDEKDIHLLDKVKAELPGILAWAVEGCREWQEKGLAVPDEVRMATEAYREDMDVIASFFEDHCMFERNAWAPASDLYNMYKVWCEESGERYETSTAFGRRLTERGLVQQKEGGKRGWLGIALKGTPIQSNLDTLDTLDTISGKSLKGNLGEKFPKNAPNPSNVSSDDEEGGTV